MGLCLCKGGEASLTNSSLSEVSPQGEVPWGDAVNSHDAVGEDTPRQGEANQKSEKPNEGQHGSEGTEERVVSAKV